MTRARNLTIAGVFCGLFLGSITYLSHTRRHTPSHFPSVLDENVPRGTGKKRGRRDKLFHVEQRDKVKKTNYTFEKKGGTE